MTVLALDFDGVLCDSARETGISGWQAGATLWPDMMTGPLPPRDLLDAYCRARPVIETGFEAILMMRLLVDGGDPERLLEDFPQHLPAAIAHSGMDAAGLARLYARVRDHWIQTDPGEWLSLSPLYPDAAETLRTLQSQPSEVECYIVTTKQEKYVEKLLAHHGVDFDADRIFGLDKSLSSGNDKEAVLLMLGERHPGRPLQFVEDRLATLKRFLARRELAEIGLHLACWGYNTEAERREAVRLKIHLLTAFKEVSTLVGPGAQHPVPSHRRGG